MHLLKGPMNYMANPHSIHDLIPVEVAYAKPDEQVLISLDIESTATVEQAIKKSNILSLFPEIDLTQNKIGIFSKFCTLNTTLREGDRIEIYRPLLADPKEVRKRRIIQSRSSPVGK